MPFQQPILKGIYKIYKDSFCLEGMNIQPESVSSACLFIDSTLGSMLDWFELSHNPDKNEYFESILKDCFSAIDGFWQFDELLARDRLLIEQQKIDRYIGLDLSNVNTPGIQEKYLKSQLTSDVPLMEVDIKRFISHTSMQETIKVSNFNSQSIGLLLHHERLKNETNTTPYSIAMMLNLNTEEENPKWLSVVINVNPISNKITYEVNTALKLNSEQESSLTQTIKQAIQYQETSSVSQMTYEAFPLAFDIEGTINSSSSDNLDDYHVLHALYQNESIREQVNQSELATEFSTVEHTPSRIKQSVYKTELEALCVDSKSLNILPTNMLKQLEPIDEAGEYKISQASLFLQLSLFELQGLNLASDISVNVTHALVEEAINNHQMQSLFIHFPDQNPEVPLSSCDYQQFLLELNYKLNKSSMGFLLDDIIIDCFDEQALIGLMSYYEMAPMLFAHTLTLELDSKAQVDDRFIFYLKNSLLSMSEKELTTLKINDNAGSLTSEMISEISDFIVQHGIAVDIILPKAYQTTYEQKKIDETVFDHIRQKKIKKLKGNLSVSQMAFNEEKSKVPRQRVQLGKQNTTIDIEIQQEQQVEVAVESSRDSAELGEFPGSDDNNFFTLQEFQQALINGDFKPSCKSYLVHSDFESAEYLWKNWLGLLSNKEATNSLAAPRLTKQAIEHLLTHQDKFQYGLDLKNLPVGFSIKKHAARLQIDFNEKIKKISINEPLQVNTNSAAVKTVMTHELLSRWLEKTDDDDVVKIAWQKLNLADYDRNHNLVFKQFLPQVLLLQKEEQAVLFKLCQNEEGILELVKFIFLLENAKQLKILLDLKPADQNINNTLKAMFGEDNLKEVHSFISNYNEDEFVIEEHLLWQLSDENTQKNIRAIFEKFPSIDLNALLTLYIQYGDAGLDKLNLVVEKNPQVLSDLIFSSNNAYELMFTESYQDALSAIKGFSSTEQLWWNKLLEQHCKAQNNVDLVEMVDAFKEFKSKLSEIETSDGYPLKLPNECNLKDVSSLPTALSRIISLLNYVKLENRHAQLLEVPNLDLSSTGMIKAIAYKGMNKWSFITGAMNINLEHEQEKLPINDKYHVKSSWLQISHNIDDIDSINDAVREDCYKFFQTQIEESNSPEGIFDSIEQEIRMSNFEDIVIKDIYFLISISAYNNVGNAKQSANDIKIQVNNFLGKMKKKDNDTCGITGKDYAEKLARTLSEFNCIPELSMLSDLTDFICNGMSFIREQDDLDPFNKTQGLLLERVDDYGVSVYQGIKHYNFSARYKTNIFSSHIETLNYIREKEKAEKITPLYAKYLVSILSSFHIQKKDVNSIIDCLIECEKSTKTEEVLLLLQNIIVKKSDGYRRLLTAKDLKDILLTVSKSDTEVIETVKSLTLDGGNALSDFFEEGFFDRKADIEVLTNNDDSPKEKDEITNVAQLEAYFSNQTDLKASFKTMREEFFRFLGFKVKKGSVPLEVINTVDKQLSGSNLSQKVLILFYPLIAGSMASDKSKSIKSMSEAKRNIDELIYKIKNPPLSGPLPESMTEEARVNMLEILSDIKNIPPLPILSRLVSMISTNLSNPVLLPFNGPKMEKAKKSLKSRAKDYGDDLYKGMTHYTDDDYNNSELFFKHMAVVNLIHKKKENKELSEFYDKSLVSVISSFHLETDNIDNIFNILNDNSPFNAKIMTAFLLLQHLSLEAAPAEHFLAASDLEKILLEVSNSSLEAAEVFSNLVLDNGHSLADYFEENFLLDWQKREVPSEVTELINEKFSNPSHQAKIKSLLLSFSESGDACQYESVVGKIVDICKPLNIVEKNIFISKLSSTLGLFTNRERLDSEQNPFIKLLDAMVDGGVDEFINFIASERYVYRKCSDDRVDSFFSIDETLSSKDKINYGLSKKILLYINSIAPVLRSIEGGVISQEDLVPRLHQALILTPYQQLDEESCIIHPEEAFYKEQEATLSSLLSVLENSEGGIIDFEKQIKTTGEFIEGTTLEDKSNFNDYLALAEKLNQPLSDIKQEYITSLFLNPSLHHLMAYYSNEMSKEEKADFEEQYGQRIEGMLAKHVTIIKNKDLLNFLFKNPSLMKTLSSEQCLKAGSSDNLLDSEENLEVIFNALESDLKGLVQFKKLAERLQDSVLKEKENHSKYETVFINLYKKINVIAKDNPGCQHQFLALFDKYLEHYDPATQGALLEYLTNFVSLLESSFLTIEDKVIVLSLCLQFQGEAQLQPEDLVALLSTLNMVIISNDSNATQALQSMLLNISVVLINNEKGYDLVDFTEICQLAKADPNFSTQLSDIYSKAPYPTLTQMKAFHAKAIEADNYLDSMQASYEAFDKAPCLRSIEVKNPKHSNGPLLELNGFHIEKAKKQLSKFSGLAENLIDVDSFHEKTVQMRGKSSDELLAILKQYNPRNESFNKTQSEDDDALVAVAAELLYRSKGTYKTDEKGNQDYGSSMEINTTQYLAILASLKTPEHVTCQIGTGEGKSRIMMISNVCQFAKGKTVDFVTSDAQLATRDFVEYKSYFDMVGAKTSMIFAGTSPDDYKKGGINFSDPANLSLFRNKAKSIGRGDEVIDSDPTNRALLLDEADKTYFDVADTRFNYSKEGDESIQDMAWVYPLLMAYFSGENVPLPPVDTNSDKVSSLHPNNEMSPMALYFANVDLSRESFLEFASGKITNKSHLKRLKALSNAQIEQWQVSAVTASQLKFKEDFVIEPDSLIMTPRGPKIASEAQLLFANRVAKNSKFSFGVHQCLHARLNLAHSNPGLESDEALKSALAGCEQSFYLPDEKQIVYSSTSKNLIDDYSQGTLKAVTGTSGSFIERQEAQALYGTTSNKMKNIDVPRDEDLKRIDRGIRLTGDDFQQFNALAEQIKIARQKNQPILIIAENDEESEALYKKLNQVFKQDIQHIHSQLSSKNESLMTSAAGKSGMITVSTDMIGRGTDIKLIGSKAKEYGLNVMLTYLPRVRDLEQIIGRSGRKGAEGETSLVLDKQRLEKRLGTKKLPDGFYQQAESYIFSEQEKMDRNNQVERLVKNDVGDFRMSATNKFFDNVNGQLAVSDRQKLLPAWSAFFDKSDKAWNEQWPKIQSILKKATISDEEIIEIEKLLHEYEIETDKLWQKLGRDIKKLNLVCVDGKTKAYDLLVRSVDKLQLSQSAKDVLTSKVKLSPQKQIKAYDNYNRGHDGRAVVYSHWSIPVIASLKGWANLLPGVNYLDARPPFADFRAWKRGHGQLFPYANDYKRRVVGALVAGLIGGLIGLGLIATGVLAPLGFAVLGITAIKTSLIAAGGAGLIFGVTIGGLSEGVSGFAANDDKIYQNTHSEDTTSTSEQSITKVIDLLNGIPAEASTEQLKQELAENVKEVAEKIVVDDVVEESRHQHSPNQ